MADFLRRFQAASTNTSAIETDHNLVTLENVDNAQNTIPQSYTNLSISSVAPQNIEHNDIEENISLHEPIVDYCNDNIYENENNQTNHTVFINHLNANIDEKIRKHSASLMLDNMSDDKEPSHSEKIGDETESKKDDDIRLHLMLELVLQQVKFFWRCEENDDYMAKYLLFNQKIQQSKQKLTKLFISQLYVAVKLQAQFDFSACTFLFKAVENLSKHKEISNIVKPESIKLILPFFRKLQGTSLKQLMQIYNVFDCNEEELSKLVHESENNDDDQLSLVAALVIIFFDNYVLDYIVSEYKAYKNKPRNKHVKPKSEKKQKTKTLIKDDMVRLSKFDDEFTKNYHLSDDEMIGENLVKIFDNGLEFNRTESSSKRKVIDDDDDDDENNESNVRTKKTKHMENESDNSLDSTDIETNSVQSDETDETQSENE